MLAGGNDSRAGYESARLELARLRLGGDDARAAAMKQVAQTTARALRRRAGGRLGVQGDRGRAGGRLSVRPSVGQLPEVGTPRWAAAGGAAGGDLQAAGDRHRRSPHGRSHQRAAAGVPRRQRDRVIDGGARDSRRERGGRHLLRAGGRRARLVAGRPRLRGLRGRHGRAVSRAGRSAGDRGVAARPPGEPAGRRTHGFARPAGPLHRP